MAPVIKRGGDGKKQAVDSYKAEIGVHLGKADDCFHSSLTCSIEVLKGDCAHEASMDSH